tara:strand:+ start:1169 stop:2326 length:1158 start_codon:yes stop_codon:yes gene_type:complete
MVYKTKTSKGGVSSNNNTYRSVTNENRLNRIKQLESALTYHNYSDNNRNINLKKGKSYNLKLKHVGSNTGVYVTNSMFLGMPEKKILRYMPEAGELETQQIKMCHFSISDVMLGSFSIAEIDARNILEARLVEPSVVGGKKISKKNMKGGEESWGATGMPTQFYNPKKPLVGYPANSGFGVPTAYGPSNPKDVGVGLLAPFTASKSPTANLATMTKTGGAKKKQTKKQIKKPTKKDKETKKDKKGTKLPMKKKARKTSSNIKAKMMKGGEESWGATGMPSQFYNPKKPLVGYPANSGSGVPTAYGPSDPKNVGVGLLAPFTASKSPTANLATMNKTGGAKKKMKKTTQTKKMLKSKKDKKDKKGTKLPMKKKAKKITPNKKGRKM